MGQKNQSFSLVNTRERFVAAVARDGWPGKAYLTEYG
jgi:hypothetical protein